MKSRLCVASVPKASLPPSPVDHRQQTMTKYPYPEPYTFGAPRSVVITDATAFQMPHKCVVCGAGDSSLLTYTQDHLPLVGVGIGLIRTTQVSLPYCEEHAGAFQHRFRNLRIAQGIGYAILIVGALTSFSSPVRHMFGWAPEPGVVSGVFFGFVFLFLVATIFCIKPFLYDAYVKRSGNYLAIKSHSETFIKHVIEANQQIV
jgi:hypothetical protein